MFIKGDELNVPESRKALCESMQEEIRADRKHFKPDFDQMIADMELAMTGRTKKWCRENYTVNITQRFVRQKVAALYAKNPRAIARRKNRLVYRLWDGSTSSIQTAQMQIEMAAENGMPPPPQATAILQDIMEGSQKSKMIERVGETLERLYRYYTDEQIPSFKRQMKRCVRSAVQTSVGYIKLGFQREMDLSPDNKAKIADFAQRLAHIERLKNDLEDSSSSLDPETAAEAEELRLAIKSIKAQEQIILREGLVFDFPSSTSIIPHRRCTSINGWIGADWVTEEIFMTCDEIKEFFNVDIGTAGNKYNPYSTSGADYRRNPRTDIAGKQSDMACVWVMWHKPTGLKYTLCDGYQDYLEEPEEPEVTLERFFPIYTLCYNELIHNKKIFPPSDVALMSDQQMEMNRTRQAMREHRIANRPGYVVPRGTLSEEDKEAIGNHPASGVVEVDNMVPGQRIADIVQGIPKLGVDPNLYDTSQVMNDVFLSVGANESTFGTTSGATATESSIAEASRSGALEAEVDELNDFLTEIARDAGNVMLMELDKETVEKIVGVGAIWPTLSQQDIQEEIYLDVVAGSNGRPNRAQRQQSLQQLVPFLLQVPGVSPEWLAKLLIEAVDDSIDLEEAISSQLPSIMMMNNANEMMGGGEMDAPNNQGGQGGNNAERPKQPSQGAGPQADRKASRLTPVPAG